MVKYVKANVDTGIDGDFKRKILRNKKVLVDTFNETFKDGPKACAEKLIEKLGLDDAKEIIAVMTVAHGDWDARIDDRIKAWARTIAPATKDEYRTENIYYCDDIHPAHFDNIAKYVKNA